MGEPTIVYGSVSVSLSPDAVYILENAGIEPGINYASHLFIKKLNGVLDRVHGDEIHLKSIKNEMINRAEITDCITIHDLNPSEKTLATITNVE